MTYWIYCKGEFVSVSCDSPDGRAICPRCGKRIRVVV